MFRLLSVPFATLYRYRFVLHIFFWMCWAFFYGYVSYRNLYSVIISLVTLLPCTYFIAWYLHRTLNSFRKESRLTKLGVVWLGVTMVYVVLDKLATSFFHSVHLEWHIVFYEYFYALFFVISIPVTIEMLFLIIKKSIEMQDLQAKQHEAEMQLLKSQINPHFLFNTLNSIYSLSLISPEKVPATVLGLGDLMRYMLMESGKSVVFLDQEIAYLSNYINLERIRLEREESIVFEVSGKREGLKIAPMLLLPFIENAFKHSNTTNQSPDILIEILISVQGSELFLYVHNLKRIERAEETDVESTSIGLSNLRRRLHILYPHQHKLDIVETSTTYTVNFWLKLY